MVDPRAKGARGEVIVRDILRKYTKLNWERTPGSGALDEKHQLKGDLYVPGEKNLFCVEVKCYADDHLTSAVLSSKSPQLLAFWEQAVRQGIQVDKKPLLVFKHNRSKLFVGFDHTWLPEGQYPYIYIDRGDNPFYVALLEDWLVNEQPKFIA